MGLVKFVAASVAVAVGFAAFSFQQPAVDTMTTAAIAPVDSVAAQDDLRVLMAGADIGCTLHRTRMDDGHTSLLVLDQACGREDVLASARYWTERGDGTVEISDASGQPFLQLTAGDGADYETYGAGAPLLQLVAE